MAYSYVRYTGNGSTTNYTFSFPTISTDHIKVRVNGTLVTNWSFLNASTVQFAAAPASGAVIEIRRETPKDSAIVNFTDGSVLLERDLDLLATYDLYLAQETKDGLDSSISQDSLGVFQAQNKRVANLADPVGTQDATTKNYVDTYVTSSVTTQVAQAVSTVGGFAASAESSKNNALASAASATTSAATAVASAATAVASAATAVSSASQAQSSAATAVDKANIVTTTVAAVAPTLVSFLGNGVQTAFNLGINPVVKENLDVYINGVWIPMSEFSLAGTTLTFSIAPVAGDEIDVKTSAGVQLSFGASENISFLQSGTGAVTRTTRDKMRETVSVKDFGAAGDGVTDDTAAIQAAATAATGGILFFPKGTYLIASAIVIPAKTWAKGEGRQSVIKSVSLTHGGTSQGQRQFSLLNVDGVRVSDLMFDTSGITTFLSGVKCINAYNCTNYTVEHCYFVTCGAAVASMLGSSFKILNNDISISSTDSVAHHDGIIDQWWGCSNFQIRGNVIKGNGIGLYGILVTGQQSDNTTAATVYDFQITGNKVYNVREAGIWSMGRNGLAYSVQITGNLIDTVTQYYGIAVTDTNDFDVSGNVIKNTKYCGIRCYRENPAWSSNAVKYGCLANNVIVNANTAQSTNTDIGSAISITDASEYVEVSSCVVKGSTHRYAVHLGVDTSNIDVKGESYIAGLAGSVLNNAALKETNKIPGGNTYQPILTNVVNVASTIAYANTMYRKEGNVVTVYGRFNLTPTAASNTVTQMAISLPVASTFTGTTDCAGVAYTAFSLGAVIYADTATNKALVAFQSPNTSSNAFSFTFQYQVK